MQKRLQGRVLKDFDCSAPQLNRNGHLRNLGEVLKFQHTGGVIQRQGVGVGKSPSACQRQGVRANVELTPGVGQGHARSNLYGRIIQVREVRSDAHLLLNLQCPSLQRQQSAVNRHGGIELQGSGNGQVVSQCQHRPAFCPRNRQGVVCGNRRPL